MSMVLVSPLSFLVSFCPCITTYTPAFVPAFMISPVYTDISNGDPKTTCRSQIGSKISICIKLRIGCSCCYTNPISTYQQLVSRYHFSIISRDSSCKKKTEQFLLIDAQQNVQIIPSAWKQVSRTITKVQQKMETNNSAIEAFCASCFPDKCFRILRRSALFSNINYVKKIVQSFFVVLSRFENISNMSIPPAVVSCWKPSPQ